MISQITCLSGSTFFYLLCFNFNQIFRKVVQDFAAVFGDQDQVFDSYANAARDIDARFYGEAHAWFQDFFVGEGDIAKLVDFQSDVVSGTMGEVLAIALFFDVVSGCAVYVAESCTRFCSSIPRRLASLTIA